MNGKERKAIRRELAAKAIKEVLDRNKAPMVRKELWHRAAIRSYGIMEAEYELIFDEEAIPPPDEKFMQFEWKEICFILAEKHRRYVIGDANGIHFGSFDEYQKKASEFRLPNATPEERVFGLFEEAGEVSGILSGLFEEYRSLLILV